MAHRPKVSYKVRGVVWCGGYITQILPQKMYRWRHPGVVWNRCRYRKEIYKEKK